MWCGQAVRQDLHRGDIYAMLYTSCTKYRSCGLHGAIKKPCRLANFDPRGMADRI